MRPTATRFRSRLAYSLRLVIAITLAAFVTETLIMLLLPAVMPRQRLWLDALLDSALLVAMLLPALYLFMIRPLEQQMTVRRSTEERLANILDTAADAVVVVDNDLRISLFNQGAQELYGYRAQEILGQPVDLLLPERFRDRHGQHIRNFSQSSEVALRLGEQRSVFGRRKDGSEFPAEASVSKLRQGGRHSFTVIVHDITKRKRAEEALRQTNEELEERVRERTAELTAANEALQSEIAERERAEAERERLLAQVEAERGRAEALARTMKLERDALDTIMENTRAHLAYLDPQFNFVLANSTYCQGCGYSREALIGRNHFELFPHPENQAAFENARDTGWVVEFHAKPFEFPDDPERGVTYWDWTLAPVKDGEGRVQGLVLSLVDVTEVRRMAEDLRRARDELELRVQERTAELARANAALLAQIAERERAEQAVLVERNRLRSILDTMEDGVCIVNPHYDLEYVNPVVEREFGSQQGRKCYAYLHDRESVCPWCPNEAVFAGKPARWEWSSLKTGKTYDIFDTPLVMADGSVSKLEIRRDITGRKRMEEELRSSEELFRQLAENIHEVFWVVSADGQQMIYVSPTYEALWGRTRESLYRQPGSFMDAILPEDRHRMAAAFGTRTEFEAECRITDAAGSVRWIRVRGFPIRNGKGEVYRIAGIAEDVTERVQAFQLLEQRVEERTRLVREQAQHLAGLEERQRLARELHDSLSQALYGIALGAHTAQTFLDRDRERVVEALNYVLSLADAGLTEMRALIFDLRPESLEMEGLVNALTKQAAAVRARHGLEVDVEIDGEPEAPLETKEALYRIALEALHNAAKHAQASRVQLRVFHSGEALLLEVGDDGVGFDPQGSYPGHLGLSSMRERAARMDGRLEIHSAPGSGTCVRAEFPLRREASSSTPAPDPKGL